MDITIEERERKKERERGGEGEKGREGEGVRGKYFLGLLRSSFLLFASDF
jgi:hypothetical protein